MSRTQVPKGVTQPLMKQVKILKTRVQIREKCYLPKVPVLMGGDSYIVNQSSRIPLVRIVVWRSVLSSELAPGPLGPLEGGAREGERPTWIVGAAKARALDTLVECRLLDCCRQRAPLVFEEVQKEVTYRPKLKLYAEIVSCLGSNEMLEDINCLIMALKMESSLEPDVEDFYALLESLIKFHLTRLALEVFYLMKMRGCDPDRLTFKLLINGLESNEEMDLSAFVRQEAEKYFGQSLNFLDETEEVSVLLPLISFLRKLRISVPANLQLLEPRQSILLTVCKNQVSLCSESLSKPTSEVEGMKYVIKVVPPYPLRDRGVFVVGFAEFLSDEPSVSSSDFDAEYHRKNTQHSYGTMESSKLGEDMLSTMKIHQD
ncbi:putative pentatricopeptide repeat-containing protein-like isoform X2 [Capsicum annuum]|nr:putative pentatricopeptide repeat-containing protein-like isoform X2 [Capsicum annuum]